MIVKFLDVHRCLVDPQQVLHAREEIIPWSCVRGMSARHPDIDPFDTQTGEASLLERAKRAFTLFTVTISVEGSETPLTFQKGLDPRYPDEWSWFDPEDEDSPGQAVTALELEEAMTALLQQNTDLQEAIAELTEDRSRWQTRILVDRGSGTELVYVEERLSHLVQQLKEE